MTAARPGMDCLCIQWPRFGPYHLARLRAAHALLGTHGTRLVGLETAGRDDTYAWRQERDDTPFRRLTLFPDDRFEALAPRQVEAHVAAALDELDPAAVAVNSYSLPDARACLAWCRRRGRTAILMTDTKADDASRVAWRERVKAVLIGQFDAALVAGRPQQAYLEALGFPGEAVFWGYDVVDNDYFAEGAGQARRRPEDYRTLPGLAGEAPFFLASSRFIPRKNVHGLLEAYRQYAGRAAQPWRLVVLGDGPERPRLEAFLRQTRLDTVTLAGFRQIDELPAYYGLAGAFVHPAYTDQWGLVVNEAMAAGLPILVSTGAGCAAHLVEEGANGYAFAPDDPTALAHLLARLAGTETDRAAMGRRSQEIVAAWSPQRFAEGLWQALQHGRHRSARPFNPAARLLLWTLRHAARRPDAFHTVEA